MKVLLLFVSVVCVVQANVVVQVIQEAGEDGRGQEVGEDGYGDDKEGGGGGEGGGGSGLVTLQNHLNDLYIQLSNLEDRIIVAQQTKEEVWNFAESVDDFLSYLQTEEANKKGGSAGNHLKLEECDPDVDVTGELVSILRNIFSVLMYEVAVITISMDLTKWRCYTNGTEHIISEVMNGKADAPDYDGLESFAENFFYAVYFFWNAVLYLVNSLEAEVADVQAQIAELGGTTEAAGTTNG